MPHFTEGKIKISGCGSHRMDPTLSPIGRTKVSSMGTFPTYPLSWVERKDWNSVL